jgi:hypothetical protein
MTAVEAAVRCLVAVAMVVVMVCVDLGHHHHHHHHHHYYYGYHCRRHQLATNCNSCDSSMSVSISELDQHAERRDYLFSSAWLRDETRNATAYADALAFWRSAVGDMTATVTSVARLQVLLSTPSRRVPDVDMLRRLVVVLASSSPPVLVPAALLVRLSRVRSVEARRRQTPSSSTSASSSWLKWAVDATVRTTSAVVTAVSSPIRGNGNSDSKSLHSLQSNVNDDIDVEGEFVVLPTLARLADSIASRASAAAHDSVVDRIWFKPDVYALVPSEPTHVVDRALELLCAERRAAMVQLDSGAQFVRFVHAPGTESALVVTDDDVNIAALKATRAKLTAQCDKAAREADECRAAALKCATQQRSVALRHIERRRRLLRVQDERSATLEKVSMVLDAIDAAHDANVAHEAMRLGAVSLRRANEDVSLEDIDDTMLDIEEVLEEQQRTLDAMALNSAAADDTEELERELEELEGKANVAGTATPTQSASSAQVDALAAQLAQLAVESSSPQKVPSAAKPKALFAE